MNENLITAGRGAGLVSCAAVLAIRNEAPYLPALLAGLLDQGIAVFILDNGSSDESLSIIRSFMNSGELHVEPLAWTGNYDLYNIIRAKQRVSNQLPHDWVIYLDADEWLQSPVAGERLREGITRVDALGYNAINFEEFVFLPVGKASDGADLSGREFRQDTLDYYFFAPHPQRLMRAWRTSAGFSNLTSGGHKLEGRGLRLAPENFILRHYIGLSQQHIINKYVGRPFAPENFKRGWHGNRIGLTAEQLRFPEAGELNRLSHFTDKNFDRSKPRKKHYWQWGR